MLPQPKLGLLWANDTIVQKFKLGYFKFESCKVRYSILDGGKDRHFETQCGTSCEKCDSKASGWVLNHAATVGYPDQRFTDSATETVAVSMGASLVYTGAW